MTAIHSITARVIGFTRSRQGRIALVVLTVAVFVLSAGAPNASIGIGK